MSQDALFGFPEAVPGFGSVTPVHISAAADFIRRHHYLHRPGAASFAFGLWHDIRMVGVCTYGTIITKNAAAICGPRWAERVLELTRLVLLDDTPRNSESYFIAQTFKALPHPQILLSYADTDAGDIGTIYQATNWSYTGVTTKGSYVTADGERLHARSVSDARKGVNAASSGKALKWEDASPETSLRDLHRLAIRKACNASCYELAHPAIPKGGDAGRPTPRLRCSSAYGGGHAVNEAVRSGGGRAPAAVGWVGVFPAQSGVDIT